MKLFLARFEKPIFQLLGFSLFRRFVAAISRHNSEFDELSLIVDILLRENREGLMVDVGAHRGESFKLFAFKGWKVLAFEPDRDPIKEAFIKARSTPNVQFFRNAVSNLANQKLPFYTSPESSGVSSLSPFLESHSTADGFVETETLSNILNKYAMGVHVDFLKIDTEGHDLFVLQGLDWSQPSQHPSVILCEFEDRKTEPLGYKYTDMADMLVSHGYQAWVSEWYPIERYGIQHRWRSISRYPATLQDTAAWGNIIAVNETYANRFKVCIDRYTEFSSHVS